MLSAQGVYSLTIPSGTRVPHWAYIKPLDHNDSFNPQAAISAGGELLTYSCKKTSFHFRATLQMRRRVASRTPAQPFKLLHIIRSSAVGPTLCTGQALRLIIQPLTRRPCPPLLAPVAEAGMNRRA